MSVPSKKCKYNSISCFEFYFPLQAAVKSHFFCFFSRETPVLFDTFHQRSIGFSPKVSKTFCSLTFILFLHETHPAYFVGKYSWVG